MQKSEHLRQPLLLVDARGIEPLSEHLSVQLSPCAAYRLEFPHLIAERQAIWLGSFINAWRMSKLSYTHVHC